LYFILINIHINTFTLLVIIDQLIIDRAFTALYPKSDIDAIVENASKHAKVFRLADTYTKEVLKKILEKAL